jgi:hypothetical protein
VFGSKKAQQRQAQAAKVAATRETLRRIGERDRAKALRQIAAAERELAHPTQSYPDPAAEREQIRQARNLLANAEQALDMSRRR